MRHKLPKINLGPDDSGPIVPLTPEHIRLLELLSTELTIYEVAALLELEVEPAERLRRQAYMRLGVRNLKDAIAVSGIEVPKEKPAKPTVVYRPKKMTDEESRELMRSMIVQIFGFIPSPENMGVELSPIGNEWPDYLWLLYYPDSNTYHCLESEDGVMGMVCFSSRSMSEMFLDMQSEAPDYEGCTLIGTSFDEAREIVISKPTVHALMLLDDPEGFRYHYVR
jgi:hypothetical protein